MLTKELTVEIIKEFTDFVQHNYHSLYVEDKNLDDENRRKKTFKVLINERIVMLDYMFLMENFYSVDSKSLNKPLGEIIDDYLHTQEAKEIIKIFKLTLNDMEFLNQYKTKNKKDFEIRFFNYKNFKHFTEIDSEHLGRLVTLRGSVVYKWDSMQQIVTKRKWACNLCGMEKIEHLKKGLKPPRTYKGLCVCGGKNYRFVSNYAFQDFFRMSIEGMAEDSNTKSNLPIFNIEFTHNLCKENFINKVIEGDSYEFIGFIMNEDTQAKTNHLIFKFYMEVMNFRHIENKKIELFIDESEKKQIIKFLQQKDSITKMSEYFAKKVIGFEREKKLFIISKALQECFNKKKRKVKAKDYLIHFLIVGDFAEGKSEFVDACLELCDQEFYILGSSTSAVGLTGATYIDEMTGHYTIGTGILSRASGEHLFLEEYDKLKNKADLGILNQALSKYEYTVTKGGKSRTFKANTSVIVIANPINKKFDINVSLIPQIDISGDLLSRFTVISCVIQSNDISKHLKIDEAMLLRTTKKSIKEGLKNVLFIKKCIKVASEIDPEMASKKVLHYINQFTMETHTLKSKTLGEDKRFWENMGNARNRQSLIKILKGVAMLHYHKVPTDDDMKEAKEIFYSFQKDIVANPSLLNVDEIAIGRTLEEIKERIQDKIAHNEWVVNVETKKGTNKGKQELLIELMRTYKEEIDETELETKAIQQIIMTKLEFEELINKLKLAGQIIAPKAGFLRII